MGIYLVNRFYHIKNKVAISNLMVYSIAHGLVDAAGAVLIFGGIAQNKLIMEDFTFYIVLYNVLAFALQPVIGHVVDRLGKPWRAAAIGCITIALAVIVYQFSIISIILAGLGNAMFHVGGGIVSLNLKPESAGFPGIYVAPGAIGLLGGMILGRNGGFTPWAIVLVLSVAAISIFLLKKPELPNYKESSSGIGRVNFVIILILVSVAFRAMIGFMLNYSWKTNQFLLITFTMAVVLGKLSGGILADKFGWKRIAASGLMLSAVLFSFGARYPLAAIMGVLLFNMTMPVTLAAVSNMLPGRSGFAFGLTTFALIAGSLPSFTKLKSQLSSNNTVFIIILVIIMACTLYIGLSRYEKVKKDDINIVERSVCKS